METDTDLLFRGQQIFSVEQRIPNPVYLFILSLEACIIPGIPPGRHAVRQADNNAGAGG